MKKFISNLITYTMLLCMVMPTVSAADPTLSDAVTTSLTEIAEILFLVGAAVCVGKCIHIGILYVMSSAADKSNAKMAVLPWLVGTFICFGGATIGKFIIGLLQVNNNGVLDY